MNSEAKDDNPPAASSAAWSPTAAPSQVLPLLDVDDPELLAALGKDASEAAAPAVPAHSAPPEPATSAADPYPDRLAALRDIARELRQAADAAETMQMIIDLSCACTGSDAGMLTLTQPEPRQAVSGTALGAGPYISIQLRAGGPSFGELVLTRMAGALEFEPEDETFAELVGEYVAKAVGAMRRGTVLSGEQQDFLDRVTEELRSPLAGTHNVLHVLSNGMAGPVTEEQQKYLATAAGDTGRLLRMIDDLLAVARLRPPEGREMEAVPVGPWLRGVVDDHQKAARTRGITLELREPSQPHVVKGVPAQLTLALGHLLANALKFTETGGRVDVSADLVERMLRVTVADTGIGFDAGDANRMLDLFARAINAEAAKIPGIGLGLFLTAEILKNHSGRIWLESHQGEGTQAHLALPPAVPDPAL